MKAILLARVSSVEQEDTHSIPAQIQRLTDYAKKKDLEIYKTISITESSTKDTRKQFDEIIKTIKFSKEPFCLVIDTIDRLQRSFRESVILGELLKQGKLELHFYRENLVLNKDSNSSDLLSGGR